MKGFGNSRNRKDGEEHNVTVLEPGRLGTERGATGKGKGTRKSSVGRVVGRPTLSESPRETQRGKERGQGRKGET